MTDIYELLAIKLVEYESKVMTRYELYEWACKIKDELFIEYGLANINNLTVYPFIMELAMSPTDDEAPNDMVLKDYLEVLSGNKSYKRCWFLKIPYDMSKQSLEEVKDIVNVYSNTGQMNDSIYEYIDVLQAKRDSLDLITVADILYCDIVSLISTLPYKRGLDFNANTIYFDESNLKVESIIGKLMQLIECYDGNSEFILNLNIQKGRGILTILV